MWILCSTARRRDSSESAVGVVSRIASVETIIASTSVSGNVGTGHEFVGFAAELGVGSGSTRPFDMSPRRYDP